MHSSRMRTGRSLTVCWRLLPGGGGGVSGPGGVSAWSGGVSAWPRGGLPGPGGGSLVPGGVSAWSGGGLPGTGGVLWSRGGVCPACTEADPPVDRITDACKNITLAQLRCGR